MNKAWLAGFIDGEGFLGVVKQRKIANRLQSDSWLYHPWVTVTSTNLSIIEEILSTVWGGKKASLGRTAGHKLGYQAKFTKLEAVERLLNNVKPFLRLKGSQADLLLEFCRLRKMAVIKTGRGSRGKTSFGAKEEKIYLELRKLNKRGV